MQSTQSTEARDRDRFVRSGPNATIPGAARITAPARERDARDEIARLRSEIEHLVRGRGGNPRAAVDAALESVTLLQIVTANIDACGRPSASAVGGAFVALADAQLRGHTDAIERGMTYTADNQIRLLLGE
jgi:hypothetical protein